MILSTLSIIPSLGQSGNDPSTVTVICENKILLKKLSDNEIICVKTQTAYMLVNRGWAVNVNATHIVFQGHGNADFTVSKGYDSHLKQDNSTMSNFTGLEYPFFLNLIKLADYLDTDCSKMGFDYDHCRTFSEQHGYQHTAHVLISPSMADLMISDPRFHWIHPSVVYAVNIRVNGSFYLVVIA